MKRKIIFIIYIFSAYFTFCQEKNKSKLSPYKIGLLYNNATNENFLNDDPDYNYSTNTEEDLAAPDVAAAAGPLDLVR